MKTCEFITKIAPKAQKDAHNTGILASLTIAQAILESGWGDSGLTITANNLFGIKGEYNGCSCMCDTFEYVNGKRIQVKAKFRKYPSWQESINDHSAFLLGVKLPNSQQRYKAVVGETDYKKASKALQQAGYATAPNYGNTLIELIEQYKLYHFDKTINAEYQVRVFSFSSKEKADAALQKIKSLEYYAEVERLD